MLKVLQDSTLSAIGDAIRTKVFTEDKFLPTEMPSVIRDYAIGYDQIAQRSQVYARGMASSIASTAFAGFSAVLVGAAFPNCTSIGASAFLNCQMLSEVSMPACETVGASAFESCSRLQVAGVGSPTTIQDRAFSNCTTLSGIDLTSCVTLGAGAFFNTRISVSSLPVCTTIGSSCFQQCKSITSLEAPALTNIGNSAFYYATSLSTFTAWSCTSVGASAFNGCSSLTTVNMSPTNIGAYGFYYCPKLTTIDTSRTTTLGNMAFHGCSSLVSLDLGMATGIPGSCFYNCIKLERAVLPRATTIGTAAFEYCTSLSEVICTGNVASIDTYALYGCSKLARFYMLRADSVTSMRYSSPFSQTPMMNANLIGAFGSIYVPDNLYSTYVSASAWSYYSQRITPVTTKSQSAYGAFAGGAASFAGLSGVTVSSWSIANDQLAVVGVETSAGHEGFNITLSAHAPYELHEVEFDFTFTDAQFIGTSYRCGWFLTQGVKSNYASYTEWPENLPRDSDTHHQMWRITPTGSTFCATFCLDGLSDSYENVFEIANLTVRTASWDI